ncbi:hypothetical protein SKAU_G00347700 [Synaphobranchus kaupii]|uniref:Uncharacterized protein n=1 Tax=Synaphobranchus kaupii TaxID=118154 RepID=A0A9Q1EJU6_SYNKA|nr:hypothetical protein SKAU_G00347700 [Synaphobranchus kaupii]
MFPRLTRRRKAWRAARGRTAGTRRQGALFLPEEDMSKRLVSTLDSVRIYSSPSDPWHFIMAYADSTVAKGCHTHKTEMAVWHNLIPELAERAVTVNQRLGWAVQKPERSVAGSVGSLEPLAACGESGHVSRSLNRVQVGPREPLINCPEAPRLCQSNGLAFVLLGCPSGHSMAFVSGAITT